MGKSLIITEKPSVAREFAQVLGVKGNQRGFIENTEYVITWCVGHLVGLVYPEEYDMKYKKWRLNDLPFLPTEYKYDVIKNVKEQYDIVHNMLQRTDIDRVYWAGDAGKEGQTIEENIRNFGGVRPGMEELRVWIDSQTQEEILRGIREARPMSDYANLGHSGIMRTIEDYAMGINFSRVLSVKYGNLLNDAAGTRSYTAIAVGRVMTCVLGMVVDREREIRNFKATPFYRIVGSFTDAGVEGEWRAVEGSAYYQSPKLYKENGFKEEADAQALIDALSGKKALAESIEKSTSRKKAPLLFNLAELQAECAKRFKISPDETLQVAQDLYEKKLTTYPRTDARVLSSAVAKEISKNISRLKGYDPAAAYAETILTEGWYKNIARTQYVDDSKVTDHYAIIPTGQLTELKSLNSMQRAVFDVIVRRFLSVFYPPAVYENVKLTVLVEKERFFSSARVLKEPGYLAVANPPKKDSKAEEAEKADKDSSTGEDESAAADPQVLMRLSETLKKGDEVSVNGFSIRYGKTSPPKRYTSGSMVLAMENAGQLIEDEELREQIKGSGIGTSATRAEIIAKLVRIHYLNLNKRTQILTPENLGEMVYEVVKMTVPALLNPKMTASWEKGLDGITQGTVDFAEYRGKLEDYIRRETLKMIGQEIKEPLRQQIAAFAGRDAKGVKKPIGASCPICKEGQVVTTPFGYGCSSYKADKSGCNFTIGQIAGKTISEQEALQLLTKGRTGTIHGFKSKAGKSFDACLTAKTDEQGKWSVAFDFDSVEDEILPDVVCPDCGAPIRKTPFGYGCTKFSKDDPGSCKFMIGQIAGKKLSAANVKQLLTQGKTETIRGFKSKAGKRFDACLKLTKNDIGKATVAFDFENVTDQIIKDVKCPLCGGDIKKTPFGWGCANYNKDVEGSCRFSIGQMGGKNLTEAQVKQLLAEGRTETIFGFKSKAGKKFDGRIAFAKDEEGKITGMRYDFDEVANKVVKDLKCPKCGGKIEITRYGYACEHNADEEKSCDFRIGTIASVKLTQKQVTELLTKGKAGPIDDFVAKTGMKFTASLKLDEGKKVVFDFPEKPRPVESMVICPKCGQPMMRGQWQYECSCGLKFWHTIGKIALPEETVIELVTTGKTKKKITGFTSKAGNVFDACLKFEENQIRFDFENKGEESDASGNAAATGSTADRKNDGVVDFGSITEEDTADIAAFLAEMDEAADEAPAEDINALWDELASAEQNK